MALWDFVKKQFVDVIQWTEDEPGTLAYRYPMEGMEIQYGGQLTVRESQMALFVDEGKVADVFGPGRYKLVTQTIPVLTYLRNWDKAFESPFKSDIVYFSTRQQVDQKWGTAQPITIRDKEFGAVRIRAFGIYSYRIVDPKAFYLNVSGTQERYSAEQLAGQLRSTIVGGMTDLIAEAQIPFLDLAANQDELAAKLRAKLVESFKGLGLALESFVLESVSLPEEIQKLFDKKIGMNVVGDLQKFTQFEVANNIGTAAANPGGVAGIGAGLAAGMAMGQQMTQAIGGGGGNAATAYAAAEDSATILATIEKMHELKNKGILSADEFDKKKAELLARLA